ncbi:hypothetical protein AWB81_05842 [Caballeronia arationis]|uniref:hypothetical protein n=1 Tax=Caballeronia arationis TaxID=1777142 RepID=UPI00074C62E6|nr:hypothetical protein [Caballeronia arationis]SAL00108.1 hypothetical protein AWB81_05842 [Caballeronia arationis]
MKRPNDQIFQLSLTEIAFTLTFILLLLLGYMVFEANTREQALERELAAAGTVQRNRQALEQAREALAQDLRRAGANPDEAISSLLSQSKLIEERNQLKMRVDDLDKQLSALTELKRALDSAQSRLDDQDNVRTQIVEALALKAKLEKKLLEMQQDDVTDTASRRSPASAAEGTSAASSIGSGDASAVRQDSSDFASQILAGMSLREEVQKALHKELNRTYVIGQEASLAAELVSARKQLAAQQQIPNVERVAKENADLRGQVVFLKAKLDARGGRDYPPCWADEKTGKVEFLFSIEIAPDGLHIKPSWPEWRAQDAAALPGIDKLTESSPLSLPEFNTRMQGIDRLSKAKECRYYVYIKNRVTDLESFNRSRYSIENFFYKLELRG